MFTIEQVKQAHSKVKSGADFPAYIKEIKQMGVNSYDFFVMDGHTAYTGNENYKIESDARYAEIEITAESNSKNLKSDLVLHQQGKSDFMTFCIQSAQSGVEKWRVDTVKMTCTYLDKKGNELLQEIIPTA